MNFGIDILIYQRLIDPILSRLHNGITEYFESTDRVIDVGCGTGSLSLAIAVKVMFITGIDLSEEMIGAAVRSARKRGISNARFEVSDASDLADFKDHEFDIAVTSMAIHQFDAELAVKILSEMKRISQKVIIIDYNYPLPKRFSGYLAAGIERVAGGEHYRNFRVFIKNGGIHYFTNHSGLSIKSEIVKGNGVFLITVCE